MIASASEIEDYQKLLASEPDGERYYETVIISHSKYTKKYYLVFDSQPLTASLPTGEVVTYEPTSISTNGATNSNDLSQLATFTIADAQNILDTEEDRRPLGDTESPVMTYGRYITGHLDKPVDWVAYDVFETAQKKGVFTAKAGAPDLNRDETGELFDFETFPMLRGIDG